MHIWAFAIAQGADAARRGWHFFFDPSHMFDLFTQPDDLVSAERHKPGVLDPNRHLCSSADGLEIRHRHVKIRTNRVWRHGDHAVGANLARVSRKVHGLWRVHTGDVGDHRHAAARLFNRDAHHELALGFGQRLKLAHQHRRQNAGRALADEVDLSAQHIFVDQIAVGPRRHRDGKDAAPVGFAHDATSVATSCNRRKWLSPPPVSISAIEFNSRHRVGDGDRYTKASQNTRDAPSLR